MTRPTVVLALVSALAVLAGAAALALGPGDAAPDAGWSPVTPPVPAAEARGDQADGRPGPATPSGPSTVGVRSSRLEDLPRPGPAPVRILVGGQAPIEAPVVGIGVEPTSGAVAVPDDVDVAGWYRFGPAPGEPGSAVLTAHVDSASQGAGAFFALRDVAPGTAVAVGFDDGTERTFEVVGRRSYAKDELPLDALFTRDAAPVLTLITCGGDFDPVTRSYEDNVVVFAVPAGNP